MEELNVEDKLHGKETKEEEAHFGKEIEENDKFRIKERKHHSRGRLITQIRHIKLSSYVINDIKTHYKN